MRRWFRQGVFSIRKFHRAMRLKEAADAAVEQQEYGQARTFYEESLGLFRVIERLDCVWWVQYGLSDLERHAQNYAAARSYSTQCLSLARNLKDRERIAVSLVSLACIMAIQGERQPADTLSRESLKLWEDLENDIGKASVYALCGVLAPNTEQAHAHFVKALEIYRRQEITEGIVSMLCSLGHLAEPGRDNTQERAYLEECREYCEASGQRQTFSYVLNNLGNIERYTGDLRAAETLYRESLQIKRERGDQWGLTYTLDGIAALALLEERGECAARLFGAAAGIRERLGTPLEPAKRAEYEQLLTETRGMLDADTFDTAWQEGEHFSVEAAVMYALEAV